MITSTSFRDDELRPRIVVFINATELARCCEVMPLTKDAVVAREPHYFLCLARKEDILTLVPLSRTHERGRLLLGEGEKVGHPGWVRGNSYAVIDQVWYVSAQRLLLHTHLDRSGPAHRNKVRYKVLLKVWEGIGGLLDDSDSQ